MTTTAPHPDLVRAIRVLAEDCDGARRADTRGFAAPDVKFGHALAKAPLAAWTPAVTAAAYRVARTYRRQLANHGIDFNAVPAPLDAEGLDRTPRWIEVDGDRLRLISPYHAGLVADAKDVPGRRFDGSAWTFPLGSVAQVRTLAHDWGIVLAFDDADLTRAATVVPDAFGAVTLTRDGRIAITSPYDVDLTAAIKSLPGRSFDGTDTWTVAPVCAGPVRRLAERFHLTVTPDVTALPDLECTGVPVVDVAPYGDYTIALPHFDRATIDAVKAIPGAHFVGKLTAWRVPAGAALDLVLLAVRRHAMFTPAAERALAEARRMVEDIEASSATDAELDVPDLGGTLRPFQRAGVAYAMRKRRTFIADEQGLGKTVQALAALQALQAFPAVIVVPAGHVRTNWGREARTWLPTRSVEVVTGQAPHALTHDVTIVSYDVLHRWVPHLPEGLPGLVADESHRGKNRKARRSRALLAASDRTGDQGVILALSGTPAPSRRAELREQLRFLRRLDEFPGIQQARTPAAQVALNRQLRAGCFVRRLKRDVLTDLPEKTWISVPVDGDEETMLEYRQAEADLAAYLAQRAREAAALALEDPDVENARIRDAGQVAYEGAIAAGMSDEDAERSRAAAETSERRSIIESSGWRAALRVSAAENLARVSHLRQIIARAKAQALTEWLDHFAEDSARKLIVFGEFRRTLDPIAARPGAVRVQGGQSDTARAAAVDAFQSDPDVTLIACNYTAGGVGITLTAASDVAFAELPWTPGELDQAVDRAHRIGQHSAVTGWMLLCEGTIDDFMAEKIAQKRLEVTAVTDGVAAETGPTSSVLADLVVHLAERGLAA